MKRNLFSVWFPAYENSAGDPPPPPAPPATFTQDQVNKFLAEDRRKHQDAVNQYKEQVTQTVAQLEEVQKTAQLTATQRAELESRLDTLKSSLMTEQERAKADLAKKDKEYKGLLDSVTKERDTWKGSYAEEVITNQILKASRLHKTKSDEQMLDFLKPKTRLVEVFSEDGKSVAGHTPKVKFQTKNEKGEEVVLDLSVEDYVKQMKEAPDRFGNLFESGVNSGLGGGGSTGTGSSADLASMAKRDPDTYRANRSKFGLGRKK